MKEETLRILVERENLNNKQKIREQYWDRESVKMNMQFEDLEQETKKFLTERMKYIDTENAEYTKKRKAYEAEFAALKNENDDPNGKVGR